MAKKLDGQIALLTALIERMLHSLGALSKGVEALEHALEPLGRLASRLPGQPRGD
jgi:hypothetical protein